MASECMSKGRGSGSIWAALKSQCSVDVSKIAREVCEKVRFWGLD